MDGCRAEMGRNKAERLMRSGRIEITAWAEDGAAIRCRFVCRVSQDAMQEERVRQFNRNLALLRGDKAVHSSLATIEQAVGLPLAGGAKGFIRLVTKR